MNVKTLCLGILSERGLSGYEIKKCFEESFRHFFVAGFGSIYPALADLTRAGLVTVESVEQEKRPDKKVYSITEAGHAELRAELLRTPPRHKVKSEFLALMYFAHLLPPERLEQVIDDITDQFTRTLTQDLECFEQKNERPDATPITPGMRFALGYGRAVLTAAIAYCHRHRDILTRDLKQQASDQRLSVPSPQSDRRGHGLAAGE